MFVIVISYDTTWPTWPSGSVAVVNGPLVRIFGFGHRFEFLLLQDLNFGSGGGRTTSTVFDSFSFAEPSAVSPVTVAVFVYEAGFFIGFGQHVVAEVGRRRPGATWLSPGPPVIVPSSHFGSVKFENLSGTLPVFVTMIL